MRAGDYRLTFGKFRGWRLGDVADDYLLWLHNKGIVQDADLADAISRELDRRTGERPASRRARLARTPAKLAEAIEPVLKRWYFELSCRFHPDKGGDVQMMKALNIANDRLRELLNVA